MVVLADVSDYGSVYKASESPRKPSGASILKERVRSFYLVDNVINSAVLMDLLRTSCPKSLNIVKPGLLYNTPHACAIFVMNL